MDYDCCSGTRSHGSHFFWRWANVEKGYCRNENEFLASFLERSGLLISFWLLQRSSSLVYISIVQRWPNEKPGEKRYFLTLTQNFNAKNQVSAKFDGTAGFALLLRVGINSYFLSSVQLLIRRHGLKVRVLDEHFFLIFAPPDVPVGNVL